MKITVSASSKPNKQSPLLLAWLFMVLGATLTVWMCRPLVNVARAKNWVERPCVILASSVETHTGSKGSTYAVNVSYEYTIDRQKFTGARYKFMSGASSGYAAKANIVRALPPGRATVCYVNPADHAESVLVRGLTADMALAAVPLAFALVGLALLVNRRRRRLPTPVLGGGLTFLLGAGALGVFLGTEGTRPVSVSGSTWVWWFMVSGMIFFIIIGGWVMINYFRELKPPPVAAGPLILRESAATRWALPLLLGAGLLPVNFALYKFGLAGGVRWELWPGFVCVLFFDFIFLFILTARFAPKPRLTLRDGALRAGGKLELEWDFERADRVKQFALSLQGAYQDYDQKHPDIFAEHPLLPTTDDFKQIRHGTLTFNLPAALRPTSRDADGQVVWKIVAEITTGRRPLSTTKREYPVTVSGAG
ncbi:MAG: DUF3592 domain-containing protein [Verrucomicrobiales bacterium]|jgi:hypothetical protein|nr:DUF3592 domain-containing protein [Verrucomicrobiales bacterium]